MNLLERIKGIWENENGPYIARCENGVGVWEVRSEEFGDQVFDSLAEAKRKLKQINDARKETHSCFRCGRKLRDEESIRLGIGPVCRKKMPVGDWYDYLVRDGAIEN